jgi:hypothetical protein
VVLFGEISRGFKFSNYAWINVWKGINTFEGTTTDTNCTRMEPGVELALVLPYHLR